RAGGWWGTSGGAVGAKASPGGLLSGWTAGVSEVSRFSCMKFLGVSGVFDYAGLNQELALALLPMLPSAHYKNVGTRIASFRSSIAHPAYPLSTLRCVPRGSNARLEAERIAAPFS